MCKNCAGVKEKESPEINRNSTNGNTKDVSNRLCAIYIPPLSGRKKLTNFLQNYLIALYEAIIYSLHVSCLQLVSVISGEVRKLLNP